MTKAIREALKATFAAADVLEQIERNWCLQEDYVNKLPPGIHPLHPIEVRLRALDRKTKTQFQQLDRMRTEAADKALVLEAVEQEAHKAGWEGPENDVSLPEYVKALWEDVVALREGEKASKTNRKESEARIAELEAEPEAWRRESDCDTPAELGTKLGESADGAVEARNEQWERAEKAERTCVELRKALDLAQVDGTKWFRKCLDAQARQRAAIQMLRLIEGELRQALIAEGEEVASHARSAVSHVQILYAHLSEELVDVKIDPPRYDTPEQLAGFWESGYKRGREDGKDLEEKHIAWLMSQAAPTVARAEPHASQRELVERLDGHERAFVALHHHMIATPEDLSVAAQAVSDEIGISLADASKYALKVIDVKKAATNA